MNPHKREAIKQQLLDLPVKHTKSIAWESVTRWAEDQFEVGTWGRSFITLDQAIDKLAKID